MNSLNLIISMALACGASQARLSDVIGSAHVAGLYNFTKGDFLNEGADALLAMGSRVIKLWFVPSMQHMYGFNSDWPEVRSMTELAKSPALREVFAKPFTTYMLENSEGNSRFASGASLAEDVELERKQFYDCARYLLTEYKRSGKTFILQNWEGDWVLTNPTFTKEVTDRGIQRMISLLNARQAGVEQARRDVGQHGITVAHAAEVNLVARAMEGKRTVTNDVLPHTHCDLYSYSAYDTCLRGPKEFRAALDYLASKAPPSKLYGKRNIYIGEFGAPENEFDQRKIVQWTVETALNFGARYVVYWQVYCNEAKKRKGEKAKPPERPTNADVRGFWLIRPDGSKSPAYDYFAELLKK